MTPKPLPPSVPTVAETLKHPAYPTTIWKLEPDRKGLVPVAEGRGGPFKISWEIHGVGPTKLIVSTHLTPPRSLKALAHLAQFIMGLGGLKSAWQRQTLHFGHERREQYSVLLLDNRGMGDSDKPLMRYSTSEMARDIADVLAHSDIGWIPASSIPSRPSPPPAPSPSAPSPPRNLHVVGISLGGMIAQELACLIPQTISSLTLVCTAAAIENTTTFTENMAQRASLLLPKTIDRSVSDAARQIFAHAWLTAPDDVHLPDPSTTPGCHPPTATTANPDGSEGGGGGLPALRNQRAALRRTGAAQAAGPGAAVRAEGVPAAADRGRVAPQERGAAGGHGGRGGAPAHRRHARHRGRHDQHAAREEADRLHPAREGIDRRRDGPRAACGEVGVVQPFCGGAVRAG